MTVTIFAESGCTKKALANARKFKKQLEHCNDSEKFDIIKKVKNTNYLSNSKLGWNNNATIFVETAINLAPKPSIKMQKFIKELLFSTVLN